MGILTDVHIRNWIKDGRPVAKSDGDGLTFTLSAKGTAAWILRYRYGGKSRELTVGRYPDIGVADARKLAAEYRVKIQCGVDVAREKRQRKYVAATAQTFRQLAEDYQDKIFPTLADNTVKQRKGYIKKFIIPKIGGLTAKDVMPADIVSLIEQVGQKASVHVADKTLCALSEICKHGVAKRVLDSNPCRGIDIKSVCGKPAPKRQRLKLTVDELRVLLPALPELGKQNELATKILLATGVRIGELARAEWSHIDFNKGEWVIPDDNSKTTGFMVPLVPVVSAWFKELEACSCGSRYVLPARQSRRSRRYNGEMHFEPRALNSMLAKLCKNLEGKVRKFTPHDLRSTARSFLSELGVDLCVAERCLNHSLGGLIAVYNQHDYIRERREALGLLAEFLLKCENLENPNVMQLSDRRAA